MEAQIPYYKIHLREELARRCKINSRYSLRALARALDVDPAVLSRALANKRALSYKVARRITENLCLTPKEAALFLASVAEDQKDRGLKRCNLETQPDSNIDKADIDHIGADFFRIIGDWYHYAIQQLTLIEGFKSDPRWIAQRLGITVQEAQLAVKRLILAGLLQESNGHFRAAATKADIKDKRVSLPALHHHQKQMLQKAIHSMENNPAEMHSMTGIAIPIDPQKINLAKKLIEQFSNHICEILGSGNKSKLYQLSISLFPLESSSADAPDKFSP